TGAAASFNLLNGTCFPPPAALGQTYWEGVSLIEQKTFQFVTKDPTTSFDITDHELNVITDSNQGSGEWTITPHINPDFVTPEPSELIPTTLLCLCGIMGRKRIAQVLRQANR